MATTTSQPVKSLIVQSLSTPLDIKLGHKPTPPKADPGTVVVRVLATPIGPSYGALLGGPVPGMTYPAPGVYGNCGVGRVVAVGSDAVSLREGQLVFCDSFVAARDDPSVEIMLGFMHDGSPKSGWRNGYWQTHATVPLENAIPLDEDLLTRNGVQVHDLVFLNRLVVAYGAVSSLGIKAGETVIVGPATGHFGGAAVEVASAVGARVVAIGRNRETLAQHKSLQPRIETVELTGDVEKDTKAILAASGGPADAFIDFSPFGAQNPPHITSAILSLRRRGRVALMGSVGGTIPIPYIPVMLNSLEIKGRWMYTRHEIRELVRMVELGVLRIGAAGGHETVATFALEEWAAAFDEAARHKGWGKQVLFTP